MASVDTISLLVVDDDEVFREAVVQRFSRSNYRVVGVADGEQALAEVGRREYDVAVVDMVMPGMSGLDLLGKLKRDGQSECEVILLTGQGTIETAVSAMKLGAFDFLTKPFPLKELESVVEKAEQYRRLCRENIHLKALLERSQPKSEMVGDSPAMREVFRLIQRAGPSEKAILIQGESGTGKELVARALHQSSTRADKPMVVINCAALPETLLESELFGHERGAFTGAVSMKPGLFEVADGGTLFIDEIGELPGSLQAKLLRVLEDGTLRRIGSIKERRVNVRLLAATNRDMIREVEEGRFREDLYYRINVMSLELPPLRQRTGDIGRLITHFVGADWTIEPDVVVALGHYQWPGNVRQLINVLERAKILGDDRAIRMGDLPAEVIDQRQHRPPSMKDTDDLSQLERAKIIEVLRRESGNKSRAARALGIDRRKLYRLVEKYNIPTSSARQATPERSNGGP